MRCSRNSTKKRTTSKCEAEKRQDDFTAFVNAFWLPLQVRGGNNKPSMIASYQHISMQGLDLLTIGMINDMSPESRNDGYKGYKDIATQKIFPMQSL